MKFTTLTILILFCMINLTIAQESDIVKTIDKLTLQWDNTAIKMRTYKGMKDYCRNNNYRYVTIRLLKKIHHHDSALYKIVTNKFDANEDAEAKATLDDIVLLEKDYTTQSFLEFLKTDCSKLEDVERNFASKNKKRYEKEQALFEVELEKYVNAITKQIDIVDEHIHHLKGL